MGIEGFCSRCKGPMTDYDKRWARWANKDVHSDAWKCADYLEQRVRELEVQAVSLKWELEQTDEIIAVLKR